ncbi:hypothetical protein BOX15_Mlig025699g1 [Macrostomum lignano]|uniref:SMP-30/Gluconolactonase/LRE-like region domain-containing protein n=2 Tax=Macrostomum lignano TaxID=282301 RepID=A0A267GL27_9PLAT|nr:hypothetical protein BOX15_Mlig025699g1 [Macrostomum lignano]
MPNQSSAKIEHDFLRASPKRLAVCTCTRGFAVNSSNRVVRASDADTTQQYLSPLTQPCVLMSFDPSIFNYLLVSPLDGSAGPFQLHCDSIDWDKEVTGLHWDSQLQQVIVAQPDRITAMDLSGGVSLQLGADRLGLREGADSLNICGVAGNNDSILLLDRSGPRLLVLSKRRPIWSIVNLSSEPLLANADLGSIAASGKSIFVGDNSTGRIFKLCIETGRVTVHSEVVLGSPRLCQIAADSRGHVVVSGFTSNSIAVLNTDGKVLQTLAEVRGNPLRLPSGVAVLESGGSFTLLLAEYGRMRLLVLPLTSSYLDLSYRTEHISDLCQQFCRVLS